MEEKNVHIVGAGISGLVAAIVLERHEFDPVIYETAEEVGGRLKTSIVDNYQLDHGFQILLGAYPKAQEYLDYDALDLQNIAPGAVIFSDGKSKVLGDPLREKSFLLPTLFSGLPSLKDKYKVMRLYLMLKKKSLEEIFAVEEQSSYDYLKNYGFSEKLITKFFRPFFAGIFLEPDLRTSCRMLLFTFKLFAEGNALLPKSGIAAIPQQLRSRLKRTKIHLNTRVSAVENNKIRLADGSEISSKYTIIATTASDLVSNLKNQKTRWKSCENLYFEVKQRAIEKPIIGLLAEKDSLINNFFYPTAVSTQTRGAYELLSVTIVKSHELSEEELILKVKKELETHCNIKDAQFLKRYIIPQALPDIDHLQYALVPTETQLTNGIFLAGDQLLNASLNAAMITGERAALGVVKISKGGVITGK